MIHPARCSPVPGPGMSGAGKDRPDGSTRTDPAGHSRLLRRVHGAVRMSAYTDARDRVAPLRKGPGCTMGALLANLDADDQEAVTADLANPFVQGTRIGKALKEMERPIGQHVLDRHRRGDCGCT